MKEYKFKWYYILFIIIIIGFVVGQVILDLRLPDYMGYIFEDISFIEYRKAIDEAFVNPGMSYEMLAQIMDTTPEFLKSIKDTNYYISDIWKNGGIMVGITVGSIACTIVAAYFSARVGAGIAYILRNKVFKKVQSYSISEIEKFQISSLITRTTNDITQIQMVIIMVLRIAVSAPITAGIAIYKAANKAANSPQITGIIAIGIAFLCVFVLIMFMIVLPKFTKVQKFTDRLNLVTRENLTGLRVVRAYNAEEYEEKKFEKANNDVTKTNLFVNRTTSLMMPVMMMLMNGLSLAIYWLGSDLINKNKIDLASISVFQQYTMQIVMSFMMIAMLCIIIPRGIVSLRRVKEVLKLEPSIKSGENIVDVNKIEFKNVSFKYGDSKDSEYVLQNINFEINKGQTVAIIGATGSGKTTIANLIPRFFDVTEGEILIDGVNIKDLDLVNLRDKIGYVPQKALLFSGTIKSNLEFGLNEETNADELMDEALMISQSSEFVSNLDDGINHLIAQGGTNVSGGQRQRLSIARAVIKKPSLLIFDDSFSALDFKTDKALRSALKKYMGDTTSLIVAQRIGTIMHADEIIVLDEGRIVGKGKHEELLKNCAVYREIAESQLSKEEL